MKKYISTVLVCLMFFMIFVEFGTAETLPKVADVKVFINDELQTFPVYENNIDSAIDDETRYFVPLKTVLEKTGSEYRWVDPDVAYIINPDGRNIFMKFEDKSAQYQVFKGDDFPDPNSNVNSTRVPRAYIKIGDSIHFPLNEFPHFINLGVYDNGGNIQVYSSDYYESNHTIYKNIGHQISLTAYINDIKIDSPVYKNTSSNDRSNGVSDFILLIPALEALGAQVSFEKPNRIIAQTDSLGQIEIKASASVDTANNKVKEYADGYEDCYIVDGEIYIRFSKIRVATDGSLRQNDNESMTVYTSAYERIDIPATLEEAYKALDELLDSEDIEHIRDLAEDDIISMHFGLGMWMRNNWLYPTNSMLTKELLRANPSFGHPDNMSHFILVGYHYYLNNDEYTIEKYAEERRKEKTEEFIRDLSFVLMFIFTFAAIRLFLRKVPQPVHFLERFGRPKFLRVFFVLCISALLINGISSAFYGHWTDLTASIYMIVLALILAFSSLFCFADMTKKQIAISAIIPTIYFLCYGLESNFFEYGIGHGILGWDGWSYIFPIDYASMFRHTIGLYVPEFMNAVLMFFPFVYVLLAKNKKDYDNRHGSLDSRPADEETGNQTS